MNKVEELHSKVDEYEGIIDNMEKEYELQCKESCTKISSLEILQRGHCCKQSTLRDEEVG
jgi:hypothetical protein